MPRLTAKSPEIRHGEARSVASTRSFSPRRQAARMRRLARSTGNGQFIPFTSSRVSAAMAACHAGVRWQVGASQRRLSMRPWHPLPPQPCGWASTFGGTKIEHAILSRGRRHRCCVPASPDTPLALRRYDPRRWRALVPAVERQELGPVTVGVGIPGVISPVTGLVKNANSLLLDRPSPWTVTWRRRSARPVRVENDANCFALSEASGRRRSGRAHGVRRDHRDGVRRGDHRRRTCGGRTEPDRRANGDITRCPG